MNKNKDVTSVLIPHAHRLSFGTEARESRLSNGGEEMNVAVKSSTTISRALTQKYSR